MGINFAEGLMDKPGILQYQQCDYSGTGSTANDGNNPWFFLNCSITPTNSNSRIMVMAFIGGIGSNQDNAGNFVLRRNSTNIAIGNSASNRPRGTGHWWRGYSDWCALAYQVNYIDHPNTTSSVTYRVGVANGNSNATLYVNRSQRDNNSSSEDARSISLLTLIEFGRN